MFNQFEIMKQKSFNYQFIYKQNFKNFYVNKTNFHAFNGLIKNNLKLSFLYGPPKSGKSFLSQIWLKKNNAFQYKNNLQFLLDKRKNVLIDTLLDFEQEKIFHIVNNCILNDLNILITSNKKINEVKFDFNDLSSRIKTFSNLEINQPDDDMLVTILTKLLIDKQFIIKSNDIFEYMLRRIERSYLGIHDIVNRLDVISLEQKRQLTIPLIKEIL